MDATAILIFRLALLATVYAFLALVARVIWRDLRAASIESPGVAAPARLQVVAPSPPNLAAGEFVPVRGATSIGRQPDNDVVVDEDSVSARHARLVPREGHWWIEDLGSTNGTWVNDRHVVQPRLLKSGDLIQLGRVRLRFAA